MAQFLQTKIKGKSVLVDAGEIEWIAQNGGCDELYADVPSSAVLTTLLRLVYGCFLIGPEKPSLVPGSLQVVKEMEMAYIFFDGDTKSTTAGKYFWRSLKIIDVEGFSYSRLHANRVPFAAIFELADDIPRIPNFSIPAFPLNRNVSLQANIMDRAGIFALNDEDRRKRGVISKRNWKSLIDETRVLKAAGRVGLLTWC